MTFRWGSDRPSYAEVEAPSQDTTVVVDPKQSFVLSDRRESEQKEGFIVPDQRECFLVFESTWPKLHIPEGFGTALFLYVRKHSSLECKDFFVTVLLLIKFKLWIWAFWKENKPLWGNFTHKIVWPHVCHELNRPVHNRKKLKMSFFTLLRSLVCVYSCIVKSETWCCKMFQDHFS